LPSSLETSKATLHADDTALICSEKDRISLQVNAYIDVQTAVQFFAENNLVTNENKYNVISFTSEYNNQNNDVNVVLGSEGIDQLALVNRLVICYHFSGW
jgi:hypothetical protein